jgi:hypothetical protein
MILMSVSVSESKCRALDGRAKLHEAALDGRAKLHALCVEEYKFQEKVKRAKVVLGPHATYLQILNFIIQQEAEAEEE